jgi:hypothetical protein
MSNHAHRGKTGILGAELVVGTLLDTESRANVVAASVAPAVQSVPFAPRAPWAHEVD